MKYAYLILLLISISFAQNANAQTVINKTLFFNVDDHTLSNASQETLLSLIQELKSSNESDIQIVGHTDQMGSLDYNLQLSERRAESVRQFIVGTGYSSTDIKIDFRGESDLLIDAQDQLSMQQNRRVSVIANTYHYTSVSDFVALLETNQPDKIIVDQRLEKEVNLSKGTSVKLPPYAFCNMDGSPLSGDKVEMKFKEAFDFTQMVDERLFTETASDLLETGGMIYIEATQNGKPLKLQEGKEIELLFPEQESKPGMELFTGVSDENGVIWEETGESVSEEKEDVFIQVDLSPITDFQFGFQDTVVIPYENMDPYPKAQRKPYPPAKIKYSDEDYAAVFEKYEDVLATYYSDKIEIPKQLEVWSTELLRRKKLLIQHKKEHTTKHVQKWMQYHIEKIVASSNDISHTKIMGQLASFLDRKVGDTNYEDLYYRNKMFKGVHKDKLLKFEIYQPDYRKSPIKDFCSEFNDAIALVESMIHAKKVGMGYVDKKVLSRYIVSTSSLGWINCDRFIKLEENEKTDLHFAEVSDESQYFLVFKDIKSLIRPRQSKGKVSFRNIPIGEDVKLVSIDIRGNECFLASQDLTLGSSEQVSLQYQKAKLNDVRKVLEDI